MLTFAEKENNYNEKVDSLTAQVTELEIKCEETKKSHEEELFTVHEQIKEKSQIAQTQLGKHTLLRGFISHFICIVMFVF